MYDVSVTWLTIMADPLHWYETKVVINGVTYSESQIMDMSVDYRAFTGEQPSVGGCLSGEITIRMLTPSATVPRMAKIEPFARVTNGTLTSEWIPQGVFYIDTREQSNNDDGLEVTKFHGYDAMLMSEAPYPSTSHTWPYQDLLVVQEIAYAMGLQSSANVTTGIDDRTVTLISNGPHYNINLPANYSMREALGYIGALFCGNWVMNYDGQLLLVPINSPPPETNLIINENGYYITFGGDRILVSAI